MSLNVPPNIENEQSEPTEFDLLPRQVLAARLLGRGVKAVEVARRVGVSRKTITRWYALPAFTYEIFRAMNAAVPLTPGSPSCAQQEKKWIFEGVEYPSAAEYLAAIDLIMGRKPPKLA